MALNRQAELCYKLATLTGQFSSDLPDKAESLEDWLAERPMLDVEQLLYQIPSYIQEMNQVDLTDKVRFEMLEMLRPITAHICREIIKRIRKGKGLSLSLEFQEMEWLINVLLQEISLGYQRLLFNKTIKNPRFYNRSDYALLAERAMYYLGERIIFVYMLHSVVPHSIWHDLNSSYRFARKAHLNAIQISDGFALKQSMKCTIDIIYKRILLLTILSPQSLRSAEIEQVYFGLLPLIDTIKLTTDFSSSNEQHIINWESNLGPHYSDAINHNADNWFIDTAEFINELTKCLNTEQVAVLDVDVGISKKLLKKIISKLDGSMKRTDKRIRADGQRVEVIIGLQNIDVFLGNAEALKNNTDSPIQKKESDEGTINHHLHEQATQGDSDTSFYNAIDTAKPGVDQEEVVKKANEPVGEKHYYLKIENESAAGVCLTCDTSQAEGLGIGELLLILGRGVDIWKLGIVCWIKTENKKVDLGVYFLGGELDCINVSLATDSKNIRKAHWLQKGQSGATVLLETTAFRPGDVINTQRRGIDLTLILHEIIWENEVFSQFGFELINVETNTTESDSTHAKREQDYLIPSWEK